MVSLPDGEKISKISLFVLAQLRNVTDRQTDGHRVTAYTALMHTYRAVKIVYVQSFAHLSGTNSAHARCWGVASLATHLSVPFISIVGASFSRQATQNSTTNRCCRRRRTAAIDSRVIATNERMRVTKWDLVLMRRKWRFGNWRKMNNKVAFRQSVSQW